MKKIFAGLAGVIVLAFVGVGSASADDGYGRSYEGGYVSVGYGCRHLRHECHEERERGYEGRACHAYEEECGYGHCERLRHACHEEREGNDHDGACHRYHEECEER